MARYNPDADLSPLYETMDCLRSDCLIGDGSLLSPGRQLWTAENFAELQRTYVQNLDEGEGKFFEKLKVQLTDATVDGRCLMAELIWLLYAFQRGDVSPPTKNLKVREVWSWSGEELPREVAALTDPVLHGVGRAGQGYNNKWRELVLLITAMQDLKAKPQEERCRVLADSTIFAEWFHAQVNGDNRQLRHILPFLPFPDNFERISARRHKQDILTGFEAASASEVRAMSIAELDTALLKLRKGLEAKHGSRVDFYEGDFRTLWQKPREKKPTSMQEADEDEIVPVRSGYELNTIFYGPPGTGKTFRTTRRAIEICLGQAPEEPAAVRQAYDQLVKDGCIGFVTFHQSFTYEDFVEGLRPRLMLSGGRRYTVPEWSSLPIGPSGITEVQAEQLRLAAISAARRLGVPENGVLARGFRRLETRQVCGIIATPGISLEILPKLKDDDGALSATLVRMLALAFDVPLSEGQIAGLGTQDNDLLEVFISLFVTRLAQQVQAGLTRTYVPEEDVLPKLRGSLDLRQQIRRRAIDPSRLHCRFDEFSENTPLNRLFKTCLLRVGSFVRTEPLRRHITSLMERFAEIPQGRAPLKERIVWNRMNERFRDAHVLARMLLEAEWQNTTSGSITGLALLFPMNLLFERYVALAAKGSACGIGVGAAPEAHIVAARGLSFDSRYSDRN